MDLNSDFSHRAVAAVLREKGGPFKIEDVLIRQPRSGEVLVRLAATGMCHTDLIARDQMLAVPLPVVLGHEGAGVIEAVGPDVHTVAVGDHVVLSFGSCGSCPSCVRDLAAYCYSFGQENFRGTDSQGQSSIRDSTGSPIHAHFFAQSSFASHAIATERNVVKVRRDVPVELLGPMGCGLQTGAGCVVNSLAVAAGESLVVFGAGTVGLAAVMAARVVGAGPVVAVDLVSARLELALELGATHAINASGQNAVAAIREILPNGSDSSLDCTGLEPVIRQAIDVLGVRGRCGLIGATAPGLSVPFDPRGLKMGGKSIRGITEGDAVPQTFIPELIELFVQGRFPFDKLVRFYDLRDINRAAQDSLSGLTVKPVLRMT